MSYDKGISSGEARRFYNCFGRIQDLQRYEEAALDHLIAVSDFHRAAAVCEIGCGTGRLARRLLSEHLAAHACYRGFDVSEAMVEIAQRRVARYRGRAAVELHDVSEPLPLPAGSYDRFLATYVLDLLDEAVIRRVLAEAARILEPGGLLCLVALTPGVTTGQRTVTGLWHRIQRIAPGLVGGCRPIEPATYLERTTWHVSHVEVVSRFAVPSATVVARR